MRDIRSELKKIQGTGFVKDVNSLTNIGGGGGGGGSGFSEQIVNLNSRYFTVSLSYLGSQISSSNISVLFIAYDEKSGQGSNKVVSCSKRGVDGLFSIPMGQLRSIFNIGSRIGYAISTYQTNVDPVFGRLRIVESEDVESISNDIENSSNTILRTIEKGVKDANKADNSTGNEYLSGNRFGKLPGNIPGQKPKPEPDTTSK